MKVILWDCSPPLLSGPERLHVRTTFYCVRVCTVTWGVWFGAVSSDDEVEGLSCRTYVHM